MTRPIINLDEVDPRPVPPRLQPTGEAAKRFACRIGEVSQRIGAQKLGYNVTVVPPGMRAFPFHNHRVNEEMFLVLAGSGEVRIGPERYPLRTGDVICCPPGDQETAHQIINTGDVELRYLAVSTTQYPEIAEYPDSGKYLAVTDGPQAGPARLRIVARHENGVGYWDGE